LNNYWVEEEIKKREEETHTHIPKNVWNAKEVPKVVCGDKPLF
jgi:hypothetical protein